MFFSLSMFDFIRLLFSILAVLFAFTSSTLADQITLKNGSCLIGTLLKKEANTLEFKTPFAGVLKIKWANIVSIQTDKATTLMLKDKSLRTTSQLNKANDTITLSSDDKTAESDESIAESELLYINPDPWRIGDGYKSSGRFNLSLKSKHGNTDKNEFNLDGIFSVRRNLDRFSLTTEYENDQINEVRTSLNWLFLGSYDYFIEQKSYFGSTALFEHNEFSDLQLRESYGLYFGHQFYESKAINLSLEAGLAQIYEDFIEADDDDFLTGTWGVKYDQYWFNDSVQLYHRELGRFNLQDSDKLIFKSWTGLRFPLTFGFAISAELQADYNSLTVHDAKKMDTTYFLKLGYDF